MVFWDRVRGCGLNTPMPPDSLARACPRNLGLVYGGADLGLMKILADTVLAEGGEVIGVIPQMLVEKEIAHQGLTELRVVGSMHERKAMMADLADGCIALPGGLGTFEEFFEVLTWAQLGLHAKPCGLLDVCGYFRHLIQFLDHAVGERFLRQENRDLLLWATDPATLLDLFEKYRPVACSEMD